MSDALPVRVRRSKLLAILLALSAPLCAVCGCSWTADLSCTERAREPLDQLQGALLPYLDKSQIASVNRNDGCDSGDDPDVSVDFRPGVSRNDAIRGLTGSPWTQLSPPQARAYEQRIGTVVYSRTHENRRVMLVAEGPTHANRTAGLWVAFDDSPGGG